jgi:hypothetical protein
MKKAIYFTLSVAFAIGLVSCSSDDDHHDSNSAETATQISNNVTSGTWRITTFSENGTDQTTTFANYNFAFGTTTLSATDGTNTNSGMWTVIYDNSSNGSNDDNSQNPLTFTIHFENPPSFAELSEDWKVLEHTSTKLRLQHTSGGDGSVDLLTFEKN